MLVEPASFILTIYFPAMGVPERAAKRGAGSGMATGAEKTPAAAMSVRKAEKCMFLDVGEWVNVDERWWIRE